MPEPNRRGNPILRADRAKIHGELGDLAVKNSSWLKGLDQPQIDEFRTAK